MDITSLKKQIEKDLKAVKTESDCGAFYQKYLSKNGKLVELLVGLRTLPPEEKSKVGAVLNVLKRETESTFQTLQTEIKQRAFNEKLMQDKLVDITIPKMNEHTGSLHPITLTTRDVEEVFASMGFIVEEGPEIVTEYQNFDSVNIPFTHPARDMQDTFWVERPDSPAEKRVLRTQTSSWQNYMMKTHGPVFKAICPGRVFRNESVDASHENTFFQVEGIMCGENISVANLIYFMKEALTAVFKEDIKVRLRPSYYPFTEPGFDLDASCIFCGGKGCSICKQSGWIEFCGCGMIHPKVLEMADIDPVKYTGFAFGFGLTRLAMMRYDVDEIRLFNSGNLEFLKGVPQK